MLATLLTGFVFGAIIAAAVVAVGVGVGLWYDTDEE